MPELAEVELARRQWAPAVGETVCAIDTHPRTNIFRDCPATNIRRALTATTLTATRAHGKRLLFSFSSITNNKSPITGAQLHLELHLGMSGRLYAAGPDHRAEKHDHLILRTDVSSLVFNDYRQFGRLRLHHDADPWAALPPEVLDPAFTLRHVTALVDRRPRTALKALLLDQAAFPGVGNWMADEICWKLGAHPATPAGRLDPAALRRVTRQICRGAMRHVADRNSAESNKRGEGFAPGSYVHLVPPVSWVFEHRWTPGGACPRCHSALARATIASRTSAWCPNCQRM
jgi:formamidopyrimidine-DNA glycosylase